MASLFSSQAQSAATSSDLARYVWTDTGSINGGNTFPGVSRPFGMVKLGPDLYTGSDSYSGYQPTGNFTGFSLLHESGTGGAPKYGVVSQMPVVGIVSNPLSDSVNDTRAIPDITSLGYYKASLGSGTVVEMAASDRAGMYQYTFPGDEEGLNVLVDVSHVLSSYRGQGLEQHYLGGNISVLQEDSNGLTYSGFGTYDNGWNRASPWTVYFCGHFDAPATYKTFLGVDKTSDRLARFSMEPSQQSDSARLGALFTFDQKVVVSRVGVSFISVKQACSNVDTELPKGTRLYKAHKQTRQTWNSLVLNKIKTSDKDINKLEQLYSALYFMHLLPTNKTGENPLWESEEPYYDDIFTFWDTHRCTTPLLHILQPEHHQELLRSMIDVWRHQGWISDARSSFSNGAVQGGSNGDNVLADAFVKGVRGKVNWDDAYLAMVKNAQVEPLNNNDPRDPTGSTKEGRSALPDWLELGYITPKFARSVSRAVEYSVNDYSLATVAAGLGRLPDYVDYFHRSRNWRNHWNPRLQALGFSGFLGPRSRQGFLHQDPLSCGGCYWADFYYQALPWEYSFNAHHDIAHLIELCGGAESFVERLETTFTPGLSPDNKRFGSTLFNPGNEPSFMTPYLYNYVNRQDLSVKRSRFVAKSYYAARPDGLPGNSDAGSMESWLIWNMIGLYPVTGQPVFLIGSPWFSDLTLLLGGGKKLRIRTTGNDDGDKAFYVQSLEVNGERWNKSWLSWTDVFAAGGSLSFVLGNSPANWTTGPPPPSPASAHPNDTRKMLEQILKLPD
ncbi:hypothetical protein CDD81_5936 [Ophiocordyceps australis]|uniref:Glycosyl hydrolase family 92 domain-containing protein n=1 Tax=Ophiocordyceps australis TaxID=1399860 RepID=A0A2C5YIK3_9HYPO|nr:hypothetical protein CDD81_5936 [Ophiocordyceps australis]